MSGFPIFVWSGPGSAVVDTLPLPQDVIRAKMPCTGTGGCQTAAAGGLSGVLAGAGVIDTGGDLYMAGFSAGHGANDKLFNEPAVLQRARAYLAFDSYYASQVPAGILAFAQRAAAGEVVMVTTTSNPAGASWTTCEVAIAPLLGQLDLTPVSMPGALFGLKPAIRVLNRGKYWHFAFEGQYAHGEHATVIAPAVCSWALEQVASQQKNGTASKMVAAVLGAIAGWYAGRWWQRRSHAGL